jgi:hypothetical protein
VPEEIPEELIEEQPWLAEHLKKSVTELEIVHGVLRNPAIRKFAFFYFRSPETSRQVEEQISWQPDYRREPENSREKLQDLKKDT